MVSTWVLRSDGGRPTTTRSWTTTSPLGSVFDSGAALTRPTSRTSFTPTIPGSSPGTASASACFLAMTPAKAAAPPHARASLAPVDDGTKRPHHVDAAIARCEQSGTAGSRRATSQTCPRSSHEILILATTTQTCPSRCGAARGPVDLIVGPFVRTPRSVRERRRQIRQGDRPQHLTRRGHREQRERSRRPTGRHGADRPRDVALPRVHHDHPAVRLAADHRLDGHLSLTRPVDPPGRVEV